jgi:hypothetical protein
MSKRNATMGSPCWLQGDGAKRDKTVLRSCLPEGMHRAAEAVAAQHERRQRRALIVARAEGSEVVKLTAAATLSCALG